MGGLAKKRGWCFWGGRGSWYPHAHYVVPDWTWHDKFILLWTLNRQVKIYTIYICDTQSAQKKDGHIGSCIWCTWSFVIVIKNLLAKFFHICICIIYIYIYIQGFPYWGRWGKSPPPAKNLLIPPSKCQFNPTKN